MPGDVIEVPENKVLPCDLLLLSGSCIVNEAMLTGESLPVIKSAIPPSNDTYDPENDQKHTLYGGSKVIQNKQYGNNRTTALVIRTGFLTTKGCFVREILFPKPNKFKFYTDALKVISILPVAGLIGLGFTLKFLIDAGYDIEHIIFRELDLLTLTIPVILPICLSISMALATSRLKNKKIFCISPQKVIVSGRINVMVFDKTGTLTEDELHLYGYRSVTSTDNGTISY